MTAKAVGLVVIGIIVLFLFFGIIIIVVLGSNQTTTLPPENPTPITDVRELPDVANLNCCVIDGAVTSKVFSPEYNGVLGTAPVGYSVACAGYGPNGIQPDTGLYNACIALVASVPPSQEIANPVARSGLNLLYYLQNVTNTGCEITTQCLN